MSLLTYNGISLPYGMTTSFRQHAVYDEVGGTDFVKMKFDIAMQALINVNYINQLASQADLINGAGNPLTNNPADIITFIRSKLLAPRHKLSFTINGKQLVPQPQVGLPGWTDAENGPKPQSCNIIQLNNTTFLISYHIIAHYWENIKVSSIAGSLTLPNQSSNSVLYNRWEETVSMEADLSSTRTRRGKFAIRSDNAFQITADQAREQMAVVGVPPNCLRVNAQYTVSPDGLSLAYQVVDKEVFRFPPLGAYKASGRYTEFTSALGNLRWGDASVNLVGSNKNVLTGFTEGDDDLRNYQYRLLLAAIFVCSRKLRRMGAVGIGAEAEGSFAQLVHSSVTVDMYKNEVACRLVARLNQVTRRVEHLPTWGDKICHTPLGQTRITTQQPLYPIRGSLGLLMEAAKFYDPSLAGNGMNIDNEVASELDGTKASTGGNFRLGEWPGTTGSIQEFPT